MTPQLVERIRETLELERRGNRFIGLCPFHSEKTPSFHVWDNGRKWRWHCHGCGATGDEADWLMRVHGLTPRQALGMTQLWPNETIIAARRERDKRRNAIDAYRDAHPDCTLPDEAIEV